MEKEVKKEQPTKEIKKSDLVIDAIEDINLIDTKAETIKIKSKEGHYPKVRKYLKAKKYHTVLVVVKGDCVIAEFKK